MSSNEYDLNLAKTEPTFPEKISNLFFKIPRKGRIVFCILLAAFAIITLLITFKPQAEKREIPETVVRVDVIEANRSSYPIVVSANGTIEAETRGNLVAQIRGEIVSMADNFKTGGKFYKDDVLIQIDTRDYKASLSQAGASLSQADAAYRQEKANAKQAELDWKRLGNTEPAPALVLRKPQMAAAKAQLDSARAAYETANLNLSRTKITAPYDGRIIRRDAVLGQYVGVGTPIAEVFATQGVEVRLPVSQEEFSQLGLDNFDPSDTNANNYDVLISSNIGNQDYTWNAKITRTDSTFDINTRQIDVIALVANPFGNAAGQPALKIGQFVNARIQGRTVDNVFVIPNKSIREGSYVYVVRDEKLGKQSIDIVWQDDQYALVREGINDRELVVTTSLNSTLAGASAKLSDEVLAQRNLNKEPSPYVEEPELEEPAVSEPAEQSSELSGKGKAISSQPKDLQEAAKLDSNASKVIQSVQASE